MYLTTASPSQIVYQTKERRFFSKEKKAAITFSANHTTIIIGQTGLASSLKPNWLSPEEQARERRFHHVDDQMRFRLAHFLKRYSCAAFLGHPADQLCFWQDKNGKPHLKQTNRTIFFNLSHSGIWAGLAISSVAPVGFDLQHPIAEDWLPKQLIEHPRDIMRADTPFSSALLWAIKEASVKERGQGLALALHSLAVTRGNTAQTKKVVLPGTLLFVWHTILHDNSALALASANRDAAQNIIFFELAAIE